MKTIWILNHYAGNNEIGLELRQFLIAKELQKNGDNVVIIASSYTHLQKNPVDMEDDYKLKLYDNIKFVWIKAPKYKGNGFSRFKNMITYSIKLHQNYKKMQLPLPDYIIASSPHPFTILNGYLISKYYKAKFIFEERDLWPLSILELTQMSKFHPIILFFQFLEDLAYKKSDLIISPLANIKEHIDERNIKYKDFFFFPNGVLLQDIDTLLQKNINIKQFIPNHKYLVGYAGTIGASNCVDTLVKAAELLKDKDIGFIIIGDGEDYDKMLEYVKRNKLSNVYMIGRQNKEVALKILQKCDILYNAAPKNKLYKYGLSAIKVPEYMYLGKYIINAVDIKNDLIEVADCGSTIEPENEEVLTEEIIKVLNLSEEYRKNKGQLAKEYVKKNLTYNILVKKFIKKIEGL